MKDNKVEASDLTGELSGFPLEVAQAMVDEQVRQGNKANIKVFQTDISNVFSNGGFNWSETKYGKSFWREVLINFDFVLFYSYYKNEFHNFKNVIINFESLKEKTKLIKDLIGIGYEYDPETNTLTKKK